MTRIPRVLLSTLCAVVLFAAGCDHSADTATPADPATSTASVGPAIDPGDGVDDCGQGQAFPDDPDFREAVCRPFMAMVDLIGVADAIDPAWSGRITEAILGYDDDRAASMAELSAVLAEIQGAG